jgi:hypothetical protein
MTNLKITVNIDLVSIKLNVTSENISNLGTLNGGFTVLLA